MKKKLLSFLIVTIFFYLESFSQVVYTENFDGAWTSPAPATWSSNRAANNSNAWHRNDFTNNWNFPGGGNPSATGANATTNYARFHSYGINNSNVHTLNSGIIDLSTYAGSTVTLTFHYINPTGFDGAAIFMSLNGGSTFTYFDDYTTDIIWDQKTIVIPAAYLTANFRLQFRAVSDYGNDDIGIDEVAITVSTPYDPCATIGNIGSCGTNVTTNFTAGTGVVAGACTYLADGQENVYTFTAPSTDNYNIQQFTSTDWVDYYYKPVSAGCSSSGWTCAAEINGAGTSGAFPLTGGVQYYIMVDPEFTTGGSAQFNIVCPCTPGSGTGTTALACPSVDITDSLGNDSATIDCATTSVDLTANYLELGETTSYTVADIPYVPPYQFECLANAVSVNDDDVFSPIINLPFDFCFYGNTYDECTVASNGVISFETLLANQYTGYGIEFELGTSSPNSSDYVFPLIFDWFYGPSIYGVHHDIDPSVGGEVGWELITLNTGCRALVASWHDVPMFYDNSILYTGMIVLYEDTNVIEVYVEEKNMDGFDSIGYNDIWNFGNAQVGVQNAAGNAAVVARDIPDGDWTVPTTTPRAWRFVPSGPSITDLKWYANSISPANEIIDPTPDGTITVSPSSTTTYIAEVTYDLCGTAPDIVETDAFVVTVDVNTWTGIIDDDWNQPTNWSKGTVPNNSEHVIIPDTATTFGRSPILSGIPLPPFPSWAGCLTIEHNGSIEVLNGGRLIVTDGITVEEGAILPDVDGKLLIRSGGNLVQITDGAVNTNNNSGDIKIQRSVSAVAADSYIYWSSPVEGFDVGAVSPSTTGYLFEWDPTTAAIYGNWIAPSPTTMSQGKGYIIRDLIGTTPEGGTITPIATTAEFIGVPRNGELTTTIFRGNHLVGNYAGAGSVLATPLDDNWNLIGNPYPSAISADAFIIENAALLVEDPSPSISGTIWLWRHEQSTSNLTNDPFYGDYVYNYDGDQYASYNLSGPLPAGWLGNIASGQAFFVLMEDIPGPILSTDITFKNEMRYYFSVGPDTESYDNNSFLRSSSSEGPNVNNEIERHRMWLDLIDPNDNAMPILVGYIEGATNDIDRLYDGYDLNNYGTRFYSVIDTDEFSIQGKTLPFDQEDTIPLGVTITENGIYQIAINTLDGLFENESQAIFIEDIYTNTIHNLRSNTYSFTSDIGTFNDRFILRYTNQTLGVNTLDNDGITIRTPKSEYIIVHSETDAINAIEIYDILGRVIFDKSGINSSEYTYREPNLSDGAYIIQVKLTSGKQKIQKVVLKQ